MSERFYSLLICCLAIFLGNPINAIAQEKETLAPLVGPAPSNFAEMWSGFDPCAEPLEVETVKAWEEEGVMLRIVRFRIGVFKGKKAKLAAVYGYPKNVAATGEKVPGLLQIHGGGQYADYKACLANAKRGYATVSIAWAGRISAPEYRVDSSVVKLFWDGNQDDSKYKLTTDWGAVDGYHAPSRYPKNQFPSIAPAHYTLDSISSPRNSGWFLCALAARRALTFLERQPEVDPEKIGVYGHSMGGKLSVMVASDSRVKAAAPSCGGISDRYSKSSLFSSTLGDNVSLNQIKCPIIFQSPANDFHGRIGDLPSAIKEIGSDDWRVTCAPHHNHQDTAEYEVASQLWFDQYLMGKFVFPQSPQAHLDLKTADGVPLFTVRPDPTRPALSVDIFYTQHGSEQELPTDRISTMTRFWHHAKAETSHGEWAAKLPFSESDQPIWVYANVLYALDEDVNGVGYYYGDYTAKTFNLSSLMLTATASELQSAGCRPSRRPTPLIESFDAGWKREWFAYRAKPWSQTTYKLRDKIWKAPKNASLVLEIKSKNDNQLVVIIDGFAKVFDVKGGGQWQTIQLDPKDLKNYEEETLGSWEDLTSLKLSASEWLKPKNRDLSKPRLLGKHWQGPPPELKGLRWIKKTN